MKFYKNSQIKVEGQNIPNSIDEFKDLRLPDFMTKCIEKDEIVRPSDIQKVCLPIVLLDRDLLGISKTGTGKTLILIIKALVISYQEQIKMRISSGEGPFVMILCPSHELAIQTYEKINQYVDQIAQSNKGSKYDINTVLCIGGIDSGK